MSFSQSIKRELLEIQIKKNCCKKAFLLGLILNSKKSNGNKMESCNLIEDVSVKTEELLKKLYSIRSEKQEILKPGKKYYGISFVSSSISDIFEELISDPESLIPDAAGFSCAACEQAFLRGAFLSSAKINDPQNGYQLEFSFSPENIALASKFYRFLSVLGFVPKIVNRKNSIGLYFKNNTVISDILYYMGAVKISFEYSNAVIEKEIRNNENRATNCVTNNIYRSVSASQKQIEAIEKLISSHRLDTLPEELMETAMIRLNNPEATLVELALMHTPPISKSGLNHRMRKLCEEAELI